MEAQRIFLFALLTGCGAGSGQVEYRVDDLGGTAGTTGSSDDGGDTEAGARGEWSDATLVVATPMSGEVVPYDEPYRFEAMVLDASGSVTDFDELVWTTDASDWTETGARFESAELDAGIQALTVVAALPDGTVLRSSIGGVKVQHPDAGTYVGNLTVDLAGEFNDIPINAACIGSAVMAVDEYGETAVGDSECVVSLLGFSTEAEHVFDFAVDESSVVGDVALDLSFFQLDFEVEGTLGEENLTAEWSTDYGGLLSVAGSLELTRVTTDVYETE